MTDTEAQLRETAEQYRLIFESTSDGLIINDLATGCVAEANPAVCAMHGYTRDEFVGLHATAFIHPSYHEVFAELRQTVEAGGAYQTRAIDTRKDGSAFFVEVNGSRVMYEGKPHILAVVRDVTERVQAQQLLEQRVEERTRELSALLDIVHNVSMTLQLDKLLGLILDSMKILVDYDDCGVLEVQGNELAAVGYRGPLPQEVALGLRFPIGPERNTWPVIKEGKTLIIEDVRGDTPDAAAYRAEVGDDIDTVLSFVTSFMAVPLILGDRVTGALSLAHGRRGYYTEERAVLIRAVASQAAVAIENARLYGRAQEMAVLEERQRLSRELHDSVSQALYSIALGARTARALVDRSPERAVEPIDFVLSQAERGLSEMRALIYELRPDVLEDEGLIAALNRQVEAARIRHNLVVDIHADCEPEITLKAKEGLFRIAQEALHNIVKHAAATEVHIALTNAEGSVSLEIRDNGRGFDTAGSFPGHFGLRSMRERVGALGGSLTVSSLPGNGATVQATLPHARVDAR